MIGRSSREFLNNLQYTGRFCPSEHTPLNFRPHPCPIDLDGLILGQSAGVLPSCSASASSLLGDAGVGAVAAAFEFVGQGLQLGAAGHEAGELVTADFGTY
jgi:hypothetical protein